MLTAGKTYDVIIAGGGLAGLALAIQLARKGYDIGLIEKEQYPFHRVCGEYISLESWDFLQQLGVDLTALKVPLITKLEVSSVKGKILKRSLPLGGFGISRYLLDNILVKIARSEGVAVAENTRVNDMVFGEKEFTISTTKETYQAKIACGCFGKRSNIDVKWKRPFIVAAKNKLNNYIGIKYHVRGELPADTIALHNFKNGYCGVVKIEDDKYCLCYLTTAENLQQAKGSLEQLENIILSENPYLQKILTGCEKTLDSPVTISQISFNKKSQVEGHVLMIGDAAGMITPLCGNGMSMALHGSKIAAEQIDLFFKETISRQQLEASYTKAWQQKFAPRLRVGRQVQRLVTNPSLIHFFITIVKPFPFITAWLIRKTHGKSF